MEKRKKSIIDLVEESVAKFGSRPFLWEKTGDRFEPMSYDEMKQQVYRGAAGLMAAGVEKNDKIALLSEGRNLWVTGELSILYAGAVSVPLSVKIEETADLEFRINHSEAKYIMASGRQLAKIRAMIANLPMVKKVIIFDEQPEYHDKEASFQSVLEDGERFLAEHREAFEQRYKSVQGDDYATISYTSGTTADVEQSMSVVKITPDDRMFIIIPLDHCFAHVTGFYTFIAYGAQVATVQAGKTPMETLRNIPANIKEFKPNLMLSVPALAKSFRKNIETGVNAKGAKVKAMFEKALEINYRYNKEIWNRGGSLWDRIRIWFYDKILFSKLRESFGGEMKFFVGGGAMLDIEMQRFFYAIGIPMYQGYGLSEATPVISSNSAEHVKLGASGALVANLELKICDNDGNELPVGEKGEIVVRGENVMQGYWKNEKATAETLRNGWLHTGDMGYMDADGFLYVLGRFKSLLIGHDGEKYSPEGIEEALAGNSKFIEQVLLHNNQDSYTAGLIVPSFEALKSYLRKNHPDVDFNSDEARTLCLQKLKSEIDEYKKGGAFAGMFPERWLPAAVAVLPKGFTEENKLLNSTMKVIRGRVEERYKARIEFLYTPEGKDIVNVQNMEVMKLN